MLPYRQEREQAAKVDAESCRQGARQREVAVIHPGAGDEESPGSAPYSAQSGPTDTLGKLGGNAETFRPRGGTGGFFFFKAV